MNEIDHAPNNATEATQPTDTNAVPIDPKETGNHDKPPGKAESDVEKPAPSGTPTDDESVEEYDNPDGSLDAFD